MPIVEVVHDPRVPPATVRALADLLPHAVSLAVECPEEPYDGALRPGDVDLRLRARGPRDSGGLDIVVEVRTTWLASRADTRQERCDRLREAVVEAVGGAVGDAVDPPTVGVHLVLLEAAWAQGEQHAGVGAQIRRAAAADVEAVQAVGLLTWPPAYLAFSTPDHVLANLNRWWTREAVVRSIEQNDTLVAVVDDTVIGTSTLGTWQGEPIIWKFYVVPAWQGRGVAAGLMDATLARAPAGRDVLIELAAGNQRARRFYERYGFEPQDETTDDGVTTLWYRLRRDGTSPRTTGPGAAPSTDR